MIEPFEDYEPEANIKVIDTFLPKDLEYETKIILFEGLFGGQPIINKYSTKKFLTHVDEINQRYKVEYDNELYFARTKIIIRDIVTDTIFDERPIIWKDNPKEN